MHLWKMWSNEYTLSLHLMPVFTKWEKCLLCLCESIRIVALFALLIRGIKGDCLIYINTNRIRNHYRTRFSSIYKPLPYHNLSLFTLTNQTSLQLQNPFLPPKVSFQIPIHPLHSSMETNEEKSGSSSDEIASVPQTANPAPKPKKSSYVPPRVIDDEKIFNFFLHRLEGQDLKNSMVKAGSILDTDGFLSRVVDREFGDKVIQCLKDSSLYKFVTFKHNA